MIRLIVAYLAAVKLVVILVIDVCPEILLQLASAGFILVIMGTQNKMVFGI